MANQLKMADIQAILSLDAQGWSHRSIAARLGVHRETVSRYVRLAAGSSKPANLHAGIGPEREPGDEPKPATWDAPPGTVGPDGGTIAAGEQFDRPKPANLHAGNSPPDGPSSSSWAALSARRASHCDQWRELIEAKLALGLTARRIYQDLAAEHGFTRSYSTVQRFVRRLNHARPLPFRRMECRPAEEAQIDFGTAAPIVIADGKRRRGHVLRVVLSFSRKAYSEVVERQTTEAFIRCLENAFAHFGGVPQTLVIDNLRAAVSQADWYEPELNPKLQAFAAHYGVAILPTRPRTPRHKGKVERGIGYVKGNSLKGRTFTSVAEQNEHLRHWETNVADCRIHGTTRRQVGLVFRELEQPALRPLPVERFPLFHEAQRTVHRDGHVAVERAYYSVPPEYLGRTVWVRWDGRLVRIFNQQMQQIAVHLQAQAGKFSTQAAHVAAEKISGIERGATWLLAQCPLDRPTRRGLGGGNAGSAGCGGAAGPAGPVGAGRQTGRAVRGRGLPGRRFVSRLPPANGAGTRQASGTAPSRLRVLGVASADPRTGRLRSDCASRHGSNRTCGARGEEPAGPPGSFPRAPNLLPLFSVPLNR